jgi:arylsulfatase A-like enzyme
MTDRVPLNILWIQTDEQRTDSLGCYGNARVRTPNLDRLARRGTTFFEHHTQSPVCVPSRVCELTSRYPHQTGILENSVHFTWGQWPTDAAGPVVTFPELFAEAGYATVNMGKYHTPHHLTWLENWHFEFLPEEAGHTALAEGFDEEAHDVIHRGNEHSRVILSGKYPEVVGGRTPQTYLTDHALDWLGMYGHVRRPFLMRVSYLAPHTPVLAPEPF